jgi:predicted glutamine amidotransferase
MGLGHGRQTARGRKCFGLVALLIFGQLCLSAETRSCRFWGIVAEHAPGAVIYNHLISAPYALDSLSLYNIHGWAIGYLADTAGTWQIERSSVIAFLDPLFDSAVVQLAAAHPIVAVAHIRQCTTGPCDIPDPHPFEREMNGRQWLMGHNGTIPKDILRELIRPEFLAAHPPQYGSGEDDWIDSDLYFILMLQFLDDHGDDVKPALGGLIQTLRDHIPGNAEQLNFFLTDGEALWAYCEGNTLSYIHHADDTGYTAVASQPPSSTPDDWVTMIDGQLATLTPSAPPVIENIEAYFDPAAVDDDGYRPGIPPSGMLAQNTPNPFNAATAIAYTVPSRSRVEIAVYDLLGRMIRTLVDAVQSPGRHVVHWNGAGADGCPCATGIYFYTVRVEGYNQTRKMLLVK